MPEIWTSREFKRHSNAGRFARRSNPHIKAIDSALDAYHGLDPLAFSERQVALASVYCSAQSFLDGPGQRSSSRRPAVMSVQQMARKKIAELVEATKRRARGNWKRALAATKPLRVKQGSGAKPIDEHYWMELRAPHYAGQEAAKIFDEWKNSSTRKNFDDWVQTEIIQKAQYAPYEPEYLELHMKAMKLTKQVRYLDRNERKEYEVSVRGGQILDSDGEPFHTGDLETAFSGAGWAIFVMSPMVNRIYSWSHRTGEFHHSSFLSGTPVTAAGEWAVDKGRLVALTAKSGHYKPNFTMFRQMLERLRTGGVDLSSVAAKPNAWDRAAPFHNAMHVYQNAGAPGGLKVPPPPPVPPAAEA